MHAQNLTRELAAHRARIVSDLSYRVTVDLRQAQDHTIKTFPVTTTLRFNAESDDQIFLDYEAAEVTGVEHNGHELPLNEDVLTPGRIHLQVKAGENHVKVEGLTLYSRSGEGLHRFLDPVDGQTYLYTQYEPADCRRVFATFEQPDLKATFEMTLLGPADWVLTTNSPRASREKIDDWAKVTFEPTRRFSTYITSILAGPYAIFEDVYPASRAPENVQNPQDIHLKLFCRTSIKHLMDAPLLFETTKKGLDYFQGLFASAYPWGNKYDQAFVPEYNLGAMENPGLVTFTEEYLYRDTPSELQIESRANTLLHEMAHMWFGDLVTMYWWDDLWLKESFADFMGTLAVAQALERPESWVTFANRRKAWAYVMDQGPTTHPIVADIPDLEAARQNFDGITYAKGASVLKQLVAYAGEESFMQAARIYFQRHAFANARLDDLLAVLEESTGKNMQRWADLWLQTSGVSRLSLDVESSADGRITRAVLQQTGQDPLTLEEVVRPHTLRIAAYEPQDGSLRRVWQQEVELGESSQEIPGLLQRRIPVEPGFLLINDDDLTYATIDFDPETLTRLVENAHLIEDPLAQAVVLSNLWEMVRAARLPGKDFVAAALRVVSTAPEIGLATVLLQRALLAAKRFSSPQARETLCQRISDDAWQQLRSQTLPIEHRKEYALAAAALAKTHHTHEAIALLEGTLKLPDFELDEDRCWQFVAALSSAGRLSSQEIEERYAKNPSTSSDRMRRQSLAALPSEGNRQAVWEKAWRDSSLSNDAISALVSGFNRGANEDLDPIRQSYLSLLLPTWRSRSQEIASRLVSGFFPENLDISETGDFPPFVAQAENWLQENPTAPAALQRLIQEHVHGLKLQLNAQATDVERREA